MKLWGPRKVSLAQTTWISKHQFRTGHGWGTTNQPWGIGSKDRDEGTEVEQSQGRLFAWWDRPPCPKSYFHCSKSTDRRQVTVSGLGLGVMELIFFHHHCSWGGFIFSGRILSPWWAYSHSQSGTIALPVMGKSKEALSIALKMNLGWKCLPVPLPSGASLLLSSTTG